MIVSGAGIKIKAKSRSINMQFCKTMNGPNSDCKGIKNSRFRGKIFKRE